MENKKLQNGIEDIKKIKMTLNEKNRVFDNVTSFSIPVKKPVYSPWMTYSFISILNKRSLVYFVVIPLVFILSGGGVVFASQDSLPDGILYPIKVNFVEPIKESLTFSPEAKAEYESSLATKRLVEAETLATLGKLNKSNEKKINDLLEKHTVALNKALDKTRETKASGQVDEIITNFQAGMNAHAKVLDYIAKKEDISDINHNIIGDTNNIDNTDNNVISNTARISAREIRINSNNNGDLNNIDNKTDKYNKRKGAIQFLLNQTNTDLNSAGIDNSLAKQKIINDANNTLNEAKNLLNEADNKEKDGNKGDAYSSLLDSESSIKEANILYKTGIQINNAHNNGERGNHNKK
jgi:hypothetical protein